MRVREEVEGKNYSQVAGAAAAVMPGYGRIIPVAGKKESRRSVSLKSWQRTRTVNWQSFASVFRNAQGSPVFGGSQKAGPRGSEVGLECAV